jgi:hypothetical protein
MGVCKGDPRLGQSIDVRCSHPRPSVAAEFTPQVIDRDEDDVGTPGVDEGLTRFYKTSKCRPHESAARQFKRHDFFRSHMAAHFKSL